jgi:hypothetical protein
MAECLEYLDLRGRKWREAGEDCIMRSFITCTPQHIYKGDEMKENGMGRACRTHESVEKSIKKLVGRSEVKRPRGRPTRTWEDNIRTDLGKIGWGSVDWISGS